MDVFRRDDVVGLLPTLLRYARSLTRDDAAAEDLVHDALVTAFSKTSHYDPARPLRRWLFAIMHNRFVSDRRRDNVSARHRADAEQDVVVEAAPQQEMAYSLRQMDALLDALPLEQRAALHLVVVEGMSYQEAAVVLDVPVGTIMSRIGRARARLRAAHDGDGQDADAPRLRVVK